MRRYVGKVVFVAGGTSGINLGIAEAFAGEGAKVAVLSRRQDNVETSVARLRTIGVDACGFAVDVRNYDGLSASLESTVARWGPVDIVVSGAAGNFMSAAADMSANAFKSVVDIDLLGTFNVLRAAWPHLRKPGAVALNITAAQSWLPTPLQIHACAAKAGIDQVTRTLALEWSGAGVRVNAIAPGPIANTEGMRRLAPTEAALQAWTDCVPLRRLGTREDINRAALWLCSDDASYITGVVLSVDGGMSLGGSSAIARAMSL
ncbi:MAG: SDR family oxidoreductase [Ramlibacter sp.]|nr:SDR family oxidoreductase [Ramlibacter sp.]